MIWPIMIVWQGSLIFTIYKSCNLLIIFMIYYFRYINQTQLNTSNSTGSNKNAICMVITDISETSSTTVLRNIQLFKVLLPSWDKHLVIADPMIVVNHSLWTASTPFFRKLHNSEVQIHAFERNSIEMADKLQIVKNSVIHNKQYMTFVIWPTAVLISESQARDIDVI